MSEIAIRANIGARTIAIVENTAGTGTTAGDATIAATDLTAGDSVPGRRISCYLPLYWALRFSTNAFMPSF